MSSELSILRRANRLKNKLAQHERIAGVYIFGAVSVPNPLPDGCTLDSFLRDFAAPFGFTEPDVTEAEWRSAEVFREDARLKIVESLVGGAEIGHSRWDVAPADAEVLANEFLSLFGDGARFFCNASPHGHAQMLAPYGRSDFSDFIYDGGCIAIDEQLAAVFWVLDSD